VPFILIAFFLALTFTGCSSQPNTPLKSSVTPSNLSLSISEEFRKSDLSSEMFELYVKHRRNRANIAKPIGPENEVETNIADYFLIIDRQPHSNIIDMILDQFTISLEIELIDGIEYQTSTFVFNTLHKEKSKYYELIVNANYSAPDCGVMRAYQRCFSRELSPDV